MGILQKIFSVRNSDDKKHKVINIIGIKFKFKNNRIFKRIEGNETNEL